MKPISPIIPGYKLPETVYGTTQEQYLDLPAYKDEQGTVLTRWRLSFMERIKLLFVGNLYVSLMTFNKPLQPIKLSLEKPNRF